MSRIAFFCIPAWGHTNPTVEVVRTLVRQGHQVRYYSFAPFQKKLEDAGAEVVLCDGFLPPPPSNLDKKVGKDFYCDYNKSLKSLKGAPKKVDGYFCCHKCVGQFTEDDVKKISNVKKGIVR